MKEYPRNGSENGEILNTGLAHLPVPIAIDDSGSMEGEPIRQVNEMLSMLIQQAKEDVNIRTKVEFCILPYHEEVEVIPFCGVRDLEIPRLRASGRTSTHAAIGRMMEETKIRQRQYKTLGVASYTPFCLLVSDGKPTDYDNGEIEELLRLQRDRKWTYFPFACGLESNPDDSPEEREEKQEAREFLASTQKDRIVLEGDSFSLTKLIPWISASASMISSSRLGDTVSIPDPKSYGIKWEQIKEV